MASPVLAIRLPVAVIARIDAVAAEQGVDRSSVARDALVEAFGEVSERPGPTSPPVVLAWSKLGGRSR